MINAEKESEEIRFGFDDITERSVRVLREIVIAQINGHAVTDDQRARIVAIEESAQRLRDRRAILENRAAPARPDWLDPKQPD